MQQLIFLSLFTATAIVAFRKYSLLYQTIHLGRPSTLEGSWSQRWRAVFLVAFGQKKMFTLGIPAVLHLFIYLAFLVTQIELIEIIIDGATGFHRTLLPYTGVLYTLIINTIEILSLLALVATLVFLARRNLMKVPRLSTEDLKGWPVRDANIILLGEIVLVTGIFTMNSADVALQQIDPVHFPSTGTLLLSSWLSPMLWGGVETTQLLLAERAGWWLHLIAVLGFILYLPHSKHLHTFLAFPNVYFANTAPRGRIENMPVITQEVRSMLGLPSDGPEIPMDDMSHFGAKDIFDLSRKILLNAYSCTECGRCTAVCPAHITGKKLSPRKIMMSIRDRAEDVRKQMALPLIPTGDTPVSAGGFEDGRSLFDYISREELHACTTCNACVEACPILIDPVEPILQMRRYEILTESGGPSDWMPMFTAMENGGCVWQVPAEREEWRNEI